MSQRLLLLGAGSIALVLFAAVVATKQSDQHPTAADSGSVPGAPTDGPVLAVPPTTPTSASGPRSDPPPSAAFLRVTGLDGRPVSGSSVRPARWGEAPSVTRSANEQGVIDLSDLIAGVYRLDVHAPGFSGRLVKLELPGQREVQLAPGVPLTMRLRDYQSVRWQDVRLRVAQFDDGSSLEFPATAAEIAAGDWIPGRVTIQFLVDGVRLTEVATLVGGTGTRVDLDPPASHALRLRLRGRGQAIPSWTLEVPSDGDPAGARLVLSDADGVVTWSGRSGSFRGKVQANGFGSMLVAEASLPPADASTGITTVDVLPAATLTITSPLDDIRRLWIFLVGTPGSVSDAFPNGSAGWPLGRSDLSLGSVSKRRAVVDRPWTGESLTVAVPPSSRMVVVAETTLGRSTKEIDSPPSGASATVILQGLSGATISVRAWSDGAPARSILIYPNAPGVPPIGRGRADAAGRMVFTGVVGPGTYRVSALAQAWTATSSVNVNVNGVTELDLSTVTKARFQERRILVLDDAGSPVRQAEVYYFREDDEVGWATSDTDGVASLTFPSSGVRSLHAFKPGYLSFGAFGSDVSLDTIHLRRAGVLRIRIDGGGANQASMLRVLKGDRAERTIMIADGVAGVFEERALAPGRYRIETLHGDQVTAYRSADLPAGGEVEVSFAR